MQELPIWSTSNTSDPVLISCIPPDLESLIHPWPLMTHPLFLFSSLLSTILCLVFIIRVSFLLIFLLTGLTPAYSLRQRRIIFLFPEGKHGTGELSWQLQNFLGWAGGSRLLAWGCISLRPEIAPVVEHHVTEIMSKNPETNLHCDTLPSPWCSS